MQLGERKKGAKIEKKGQWLYYYPAVFFSAFEARLSTKPSYSSKLEDSVVFLDTDTRLRYLGGRFQGRGFLVTLISIHLNYLCRKYSRRISPLRVLPI